MNKAATPPVKALPAKATRGDAAPAKSSDGGISIVALLIVTVMGAGMGAAFGMVIPPVPQAEVEHRQAEMLKSVTGTVLVPMNPITTNIGSTGRTWIRLEAAALVQSDVADQGPLLVAKITEDIVSFLRTVSLEQLEGASGFQHLIEDLNDRARLRSEGKITELLIQALLIE